jgi:branched-chain amino acid transport system substrate-binding protein
MVLRRRSRSRHIALAAAALLALLAFSACSSKASSPSVSPSTGSTGTGTGTGTDSKFPAGGLSQAQASQYIEQLEGPIPKSAGTTTRGVTGHTITIAGVADVTAEGQTISAGGCVGAEARFARANRDGGVNGYKINYIGCDDAQSQATLALQDIQKAVDDQHAFAIVPMSSTEVSGTFLNQNHVPYFGYGGGPAYCPGYASLSYSVSPVDGVGCTLAPAAANESVLSDEALAVVWNGLHMKPSSIKWALVGQDLSFIKLIQDDYANIVEDHIGGRVVYNADPGPAPGSPPLADWGPVAQAVVNSGANVVDTILTVGTAFEGLVAALKAAGYKGVIYSSTNDGIDLTNPSIAAILQNVYLQAAWGSATVFPGSFMNQIQADLKAIGSNVSPNQESTIYSYMSADFFLQALAKLKGPLTAENLINMINSGFTFPGEPNGYGSIPYPGGRLAQDDYVGLFQVQGTKLVGVLPPAEYGQNFFVPA